MVLKSQEFPNLTIDCQFSVQRSNRELFENEAENFTLNQQKKTDGEKDDEEDEVNKAFGHKSHCNLLVLVNHAKKLIQFLPLVKIRYEKGTRVDWIEKKVVWKIKPITKSKNVREIKLESTKAEKFIQIFFIRSDGESVETKDCLVLVTHGSIQIYNKSFQLIKLFEGLNIRACVGVHENYLYTSSDKTTKPYVFTDVENDEEPEE